MVVRRPVLPALLGLLLFAALPALPALADLYVTASGYPSAVSAFADDADGNALPLRTLAGPSTGIAYPYAMVVDPIRHEVYVTQSVAPAIAVYPQAFHGDMPPLRVIEIPGAKKLIGLALDPVHDELYATDFDAATVWVVPRAASGAVMPLRVLAGPSTGLAQPFGIALDLARDQIVVTDDTSRISTFRRTATGDEPPLSVLAGLATELEEPGGVLIDAAHDELVVSNLHGSVNTYARLASGNTAPLRRIAGPHTLLHQSYGLALQGDEIVVANTAQSNDVVAFPRTANGDVPPVRHLAGDQTGLSLPAALAATCHGVCLADRRFEIRANWQTPDGQSGEGVGTAITTDTGDFYFFGPSNLEVLVKVIDGCAYNGHYWVFAGGLTNVKTSLTVTDTATGLVRTYANPQGKAFQPIQDVQAFASCPASPKPPMPAALPSWNPAGTSSVTGSPCPGFCLGNGRFSVAAVWAAQGHHGTAAPIPLTADTGALWFFAPANVETIVKVVDGCAINGHFWVFAAGLTNVAVDLTVTDLQSGVARTYHNPAGKAFQPVQDVAAFASCP